MVADRYRLLQEIGRGGYAIVYRALDTNSDQEVALKTIRPITPRPEETLGRFRREANLIASLKHPNTVRLLDFGLDDEVYIAMELLHGRPLSDELEKHHRLPINRSMAIACEILKSLAEAHVLGIIHRDLKPENVFLVANPDGTESIKVLDFGIAKLTKDAPQFDPTALTLQGRAMGTPNYMSPEQAKGQDLTPHSDLYTVGILLYEMITGRPPFAGGTAMDIMLRQVNAPVPRLPISELRDTPIERAIRKVLAKEPAKRFASAEQMLAALGGLSVAPVGQLAPARTLQPEGALPVGAASLPKAPALGSSAQSLAVSPLFTRPVRSRWLSYLAIAGYVALAIALALLLYIILS
ncbi:MAG: serine/threonine protein kinase [Bradymonadales bacterium]|nr:serine/threonine protein kinase [Bradymonadales bacterium]